MSTTHTPRPSHHAFSKSVLDDRAMTPEENRPFFLERKENGLVSQFITNVTDENPIDNTSPYSFHYFNENLEIHGDAFPTDRNDEGDEENLHNQMRGETDLIFIIIKIDDNWCDRNR